MGEENQKVSHAQALSFDGQPVFDLGRGGGPAKEILVEKLDDLARYGTSTKLSGELVGVGEAGRHILERLAGGQLGGPMVEACGVWFSSEGGDVQAVNRHLVSIG